MKKSIKEKFDTLDFKSVLLTIAVFVIVLIVFLYFSNRRDRLREVDNESFKGQTKAGIVSIEPLNIIRNSRWKGTKIYIEGYKVLYRYKVNNQIYQKNDIIPVSGRNQKLITRLLEMGTEDSLSVKYDMVDPEKSIIADE